MDNEEAEQTPGTTKSEKVSRIIQILLFVSPTKFRKAIKAPGITKGVWGENPNLDR